MPEIEIKGLSELRLRLLTFPAKIQKRVLNKAMAAGARLVAAEVRRQAPVDSGALKRNVVAKSGPARFRAGADSRYIVGVRHGKVNTRTTVTRRGKTKGRKLSAYDKRGQDPFYYRFQELGFTAVGRTPASWVQRVAKRDRKGRFSFQGGRLRRSGRKIAGKHFLSRGFNASVGRATEKIRAVLAAELDKLK